MQQPNVLAPVVEIAGKLAWHSLPLASSFVQAVKKNRLAARVISVVFISVEIIFQNKCSRA
jgi:hypothetical protein